MRLQFRQSLTEAIQEQKTLQLSQYIHQAVLQKSQWRIVKQAITM